MTSYQKYIQHCKKQNDSDKIELVGMSEELFCIAEKSIYVQSPNEFNIDDYRLNVILIDIVAGYYMLVPTENFTLYYVSYTETIEPSRVTNVNMIQKMKSVWNNTCKSKEFYLS